MSGREIQVPHLVEEICSIEWVTNWLFVENSMISLLVRAKSGLGF